MATKNSNTEQCGVSQINAKRRGVLSRGWHAERMRVLARVVGV